jgi:hypothetical protein
MQTVRAGLTSQFANRRAIAAKELKWKDYVEQGFIIAGGPESVRQQLEEVAKALNVGQMMLLLQFGSMPRELVRKNTELFATEVMPHLRSLWSEYEDRWWIKPLPGEAQARPEPAGLAGVPAGGGA